MSTTTRVKPDQVSEEANAKQLELAQAQGKAYLKALQYMAKKEASVGGEKRAGDYVVAYAVEPAEGMYMRKNGRFTWMEPDRENAHIEISVRDAVDNRFVPGLNVSVTVIDREGKRVGKHRQPFLWHPWLYHYSLNWRLPGSGKYTVEVHIEAPDFMLHDRKNGKRYLKDVDVVFKNVEIETGKK